MTLTTRGRMRDPPAPELQRVDGLGGHAMAQAGRHHDREHQRQDDRVVVGEFEDDEHGGDRCARGAGEDGAHPDERVGARRRGEAGQQPVNGLTEGGAEHRAHEQRRERTRRPSRRSRSSGSWPGASPRAARTRTRSRSGPRPRGTGPDTRRRTSAAGRAATAPSTTPPTAGRATPGHARTVGEVLAAVEHADEGDADDRRKRTEHARRARTRPARRG